MSAPALVIAHFRKNDHHDVIGAATRDDAITMARNLRSRDDVTSATVAIPVPDTFAGLTEHETETLVRFAASIVVDGYGRALASFSDPDEVETLARRTARELYGKDA